MPINSSAYNQTYLIWDCYSLGMQVVFFTSPLLWVVNLGFIYAYVSRFTSREREIRERFGMMMI